MRMIFTIGLFFAIAGCSSAPSFVGTWHAGNLTVEGMPDGASSSTVVINRDGTFGATFDNAAGDLVAGANGTWSAMESGGIKMVVPDGPEGTATLLDEDTMLAAGEGGAIRFQRQQ